VRVTFSDLLVSKYETKGTGEGNIVPLDQIALNFTKVEVEYKEQKPDGSLGGAIKAFYDMKQQISG
jgi:type VI secretion system secreted protein Hcp